MVNRNEFPMRNIACSLQWNTIQRWVSFSPLTTLTFEKLVMVLRLEPSIWTFSGCVLRPSEPKGLVNRKQFLYRLTKLFDTISIVFKCKLF